MIQMLDWEMTEVSHIVTLVHTLGFLAESMRVAIIDSSTRNASSIRKATSIVERLMPKASEQMKALEFLLPKRNEQQGLLMLPDEDDNMDDSKGSLFSFVGSSESLVEIDTSNALFTGQNSFTRTRFLTHSKSLDLSPSLCLGPVLPLHEPILWLGEVPGEGPHSCD